MISKYIKNIEKNSFKGVLMTISFILAAALGILILFFYVYLPLTTHHGQSITVPNLIGMEKNELDSCLEKNYLTYVITDTSNYSPDYKPYSILKQNPAPGSKVKKYRKIYISTNSVNPPKITMPNVTGVSIKSASLLLQSVGLKIGEIKYVPDKFKNLVLKQLFEGKEITEGTMITQGSTIYLVVGDGLGTMEFEMPDLIGMKKEEAELVIKGSDLKVGSVIYTKSYLPKGTIIKQKPEGKNKTMIHVGDEVDLWIAK